METTMTVKELAIIFKLSYNQTLLLLKSGSIPYLKIGKCYRVPRKTVERLLETDKPIVLDMSRKEEK